MAASRYITIKVRYDRHPDHGRSLSWLAPELKDAGLKIIDDRLDAPSPSRTWAGAVDADTLERFAEAWRLSDAQRTPRRYVLDGMNWEADGVSPVVYVVVEVRRASPAGASLAVRSVLPGLGAPLGAV